MQDHLPGTSTPRRRGYQRNAVERRLSELRRQDVRIDGGRAAVLRDLADAIDAERDRLRSTPDLSAGPIGRLLAELAAMWDAWAPVTERSSSLDPWDSLAAHLERSAVGHPQD